jgi:hypothetical protein
MELSPSSEADNCAAIQELSILWNPKVHYRVHKIHLLVTILNQINPINTILSHLSKIHLILSTHLRLSLPSGLFPSGFPTNILYIYSASPHSCYMPCSSHPPWLDHSNCTWRRVQVMKLLIMQFSPILHHFISLRCKYSPQHPALKHPQSMYVCM